MPQHRAASIRNPMSQAPPQIISDLVAQFERNLEAYRSQGYNETQVRQEFINPFFEALGWDMANKAKQAGDKTRLQRQIDATDREIDRLVYDLYGLTEEEIAIMEQDQGA